jgi:hypothetical protein
MGALGGRDAQHGFQDVDFLLPVLDQLLHDVRQPISDGLDLLLGLHGALPFLVWQC